MATILQYVALFQVNEDAQIWGYKIPIDKWRASQPRFDKVLLALRKKEVITEETSDWFYSTIDEWSKTCDDITMSGYSTTVRVGARERIDKIVIVQTFC